MNSVASVISPLTSGEITALGSWLLVALACGLDRLIGDPQRLLHPVQVMGWWIARLQRLAETLVGDRPLALRLAGLVITLLLLAGSGAAGWGLEQLARWHPAVGAPLLLLALSSALAGGSLERAVVQVLQALPQPGATGNEDTTLVPARTALSWIVGRDTTRLDRAGILRAAAETASENAVDGLFAPLFWMLLGAALAALNPTAAVPGPLAFAWAYKACSTLDSMLGYRRGRLRWLGTAGARLEDLLTWIPCRLVALSLPTAAGRPGCSALWLRAALREGAADPSPNAGVSQAAYAWAAGVQLGGINRYPDGLRAKPILAAGQAAADRAGVERILALSRRLELLWLLVAAAAALLLSGRSLHLP
ncbi:MAG: adenosylcobinamide-phosphate synthase CbiB [Cyanobium sp.]